MTVLIQPKFRETTLRLALGLALGMIASCAIAQQDKPTPGQQDKPTPGGRQPYDRTTASGNLTPQQFAQSAGWAGLKEVRLGELAQQKSQDTSVRQFAQSMVQDHAQANQQLLQMAQRKGFTLPNTNAFQSDRRYVREPDPKQGAAAEKQTGREGGLEPTGRPGMDPAQSRQQDIQTYQMLQSLSGKEFDKAYIQEMVKDHNKAVQFFTMASQSLTDPELKQFATETLPKLQEHQQHAQKIAQENNWTAETTTEYPRTPDKDK